MANHSFRGASTLLAVIIGLFLTTFFHASISQAAAATDSSALARQFAAPPAQYRLYAWWHWMGLSISKYGIKRDLTAMKRAGIAGATICPVASQAAVGTDMPNSGVPPVHYWTAKWWRMVKYAVIVAKRLHLKLGLENCPGFSASGGPWIPPALSMKKIVWSVTLVRGPAVLQKKLPQPHAVLNLYRDVCVLAVPAAKIVHFSDILDISADMNKKGILVWHAPAGSWRVYRYGYTSTGESDIPVPDGVHSLEADKLSVKAATFHIEHVIHAVKSHLGAAVGHTFTHILFDSYEAGSQTWTKHFRRDFIALRHYDPLPWLPVLSGVVIGSPQKSQRFKYDFRRTIAQLFKRNDFDVYHRLIDAAGLKMCLEPYTGPFNTVACAASCDVTMGEFWNHSRTGIGWNVAGAARADGRTLVGGETLTGPPLTSRMTETPAFLKPALDGGFLSGVNQCYLHEWAHQALNKKYKPGILMAWWGTHFGENQTWFKPGIAFFNYINRCQTMLRQGQQVCDTCVLNSSPSQLSMDAVSLSLFYKATVKHGKIVLPTGRSYWLMVLPESRQMLPSVAKKLQSLVAAGAVVIGPKPTTSPSLTDYPQCDKQVAAIARKVWGNCNGTNIKEHRFGKGIIAWNVSVSDMLKQIGSPPDFQAPAALVAIHRHAPGLDIYFVVNRGTSWVSATAWFHVQGKIPEQWYPASGRRLIAGQFRQTRGGTALPLHLAPQQSVFVVFRRPVGNINSVVELTRDNQPSHHAELTIDSHNRFWLLASSPGQYQITFAAGQKASVVVPALPPALPVHGAWKVAFTPGWGAPPETHLARLMSWTDSSNSGIKYFSGTGTYTKTIHLSNSFVGAGRRIILNLGQVNDMAHVWINGKDFGVLWHAPFTVDITSAVKAGLNNLRIEVTNTWQNRLIGDDQQPSDMQWGRPLWGWQTVGGPLVRFPNWVVHNSPRPSSGRYTFETWNYYNKNSPLHPSGLLGPVQLQVRACVVVPAATKN